jgi:hypothetical protein
MADNEDPRLKKIRYYASTWKNFFDYWKDKGVDPDPYKGMEYEYPVKKKQSESELPIQDFGTYDKSKMNRVIESFEQWKEKNKGES